VVEAASLDPLQTPPPDLETAAAPLLRGGPHHRGRNRPLQPGEDAGPLIHVSWSADQHALQHRRGRPRRSTLPPDEPRRCGLRRPGQRIRRL